MKFRSVAMTAVTAAVAGVMLASAPAHANENSTPANVASTHASATGDRPLLELVGHAGSYIKEQASHLFSGEGRRG